MQDRFKLLSILRERQGSFHPIVPFNPKLDKLFPFDFTENNRELSVDQIEDTNKFSDYINKQLKGHFCRYGIGGYGEHRTLYARSKHFDGGEEPRRLHLGTDIWGEAGTRVMCPADGIVHSFGFNNNDSDYGATIILTHNIERISFHSLFGHLSLNSIKNLEEGKRIEIGEVFTEFGMRFENGNWPAHLHFQIIIDMEGRKGDYPGVCKYSEKDKWLLNSPDPDLILDLSKYIP
jgi:murein DD-endopeptidase MepM/ murein hydrolase activator NlpD